ncbi:hypothetical protein D3C73_1421670 [compost metagenome]
MVAAEGCWEDAAPSLIGHAAISIGFRSSSVIALAFFLAAPKVSMASTNEPLRVSWMVSLP